MDTSIIYKILYKIRNTLSNFVSYIFKQSEFSPVVDIEEPVYAYNFPDGSIDVLEKLYNKRPIIIISEPYSDDELVKNLVCYKDTAINFKFENILSVEEVFDIGAKGKEFHRNLYILNVLNKYGSIEQPISHIRADSRYELIGYIKKLINSNDFERNLYNIQGILFQEQGCLSELLDLIVQYRNLNSGANNPFLIKLLDEYCFNNPAVFTEINNRVIKSRLYDYYINNSLSKIDFGFVGFPVCLHETIRSIYPFFKIQFINKKKSQLNNVFYSNKTYSNLSNIQVENSLHVLDLGYNQKDMHHNLYILDYLKKNGMIQHFHNFIYRFDNLTFLEELSRDIKHRVHTVNDSDINILCILYTRMSQPSMFFDEINSLQKINGSFLISLIQDKLSFTSYDAKKLVNEDILKHLSIKMYQNMYYEKALIFLKLLLEKGNTEYINYYGLTLFKLNRLADAEMVFDDLILQNGDNYIYWSYIGMVYMRQLKYEEAIKAYQKVLTFLSPTKDVKRLKQLSNYHHIIANAAARVNKLNFSNYHYMISIMYWPSNYGVYTILYSNNARLYQLSKSWLVSIEYSLRSLIYYYEAVNNIKVKKFYASEKNTVIKRVANSLINTYHVKVTPKLIHQPPLRKFLYGNIEFLYKQLNLIQCTIANLEVLEGNVRVAVSKLQETVNYASKHQIKAPYLQLAEVYLSSQQYELALDNYREVLDIDKNDIDAIHGIARCLIEQGSYELATQYIDRNDRAFDEVRYRNNTMIMKQNLAFGLKKYPVAWSYYKNILLSNVLQISECINYVQEVSKVSKDDSVLLVGIWGPGDELRWASLYNELKSVIPNLTITCEPRLYSLLSRSFPNINFQSSHRTIRGKYEPNKEHLYNELPDVALISAFDNTSYKIATNKDKVILVTDTLEELRDTEESFKPNEGFIITDSRLDVKWNQRLKMFDNKPKIGISWKSGLVDIHRGIHYTGIESWLPLLNSDRYTFINLQYSGYECDIALLKDKHNIDLIHFEDIDLKDDFENTASMIKNLDCVIAPCNTIAELAGALGVPTILTSNAPDIASRIKRKTSQDLWFDSIHHIRATSLGDKESIVKEVVLYIDKVFK